jgi:hypothetical protein
MKAAREADADPASLGESERTELRRLRKENADLKAVREILRKPAAYFAPSSGNAEVDLPQCCGTPRRIDARQQPTGKSTAQCLSRTSEYSGESDTAPCAGRRDGGPSA